ncbi:hypothetical protein MES4922_360152 [Mesorhizobium ventifaucium]|uniref:Uncharacterized protein n=1 Tax=Mesorhizobium ventifaucium TaxID=666020 RepID=A0ABM9E703_9HYPH|nr:hypothetical protein MES4922_360152 [Mesorhizobium ventifaucium]
MRPACPSSITIGCSPSPRRNRRQGSPTFSTMAAATGAAPTPPNGALRSAISAGEDNAKLLYLAVAERRRLPFHPTDGHLHDGPGTIIRHNGCLVTK